MDKGVLLAGLVILVIVLILLIVVSSGNSSTSDASLLLLDKPLVLLDKLPLPAYYPAVALL